MRSEMSPECGKRRNAKNTAVIHIYADFYDTISTQRKGCKYAQRII